ncbi:LexA family transcriptional regulator [Streptococcus jiangjianxini]|uniref:LexA family transcriptional regulator n=1 Tax=Streptococcus jiangjianxini TaxID=3161189 RepID=UPI0032EC4E09
MARGRGKSTPQDKEAMIFISNKINQLLLENKLKQSHLADMLEIPRSSFNEYVKGNALPKPGNVQKIADYFGLLKSDIDPRFKPSSSTPSPTPQVLHLDRELEEPRHSQWISHGEKLLDEQEAEKTTVNEPLYEYKVFEKLAAGTGYTYFNDGNFDIVFHDEKMDHDFASWVFGDSMEPTYLNGEVVLIKQTGFDYNGAIYAVDWDGQTYIKKVYQEENGLRLVSLNKKYADKFAPYDEDPRIIGKIVGHFQPSEG